MTRKPFDLEAAKRGELFETETGRKCRLITDELKGHNHIVVAIEWINYETIEVYSDTYVRDKLFMSEKPKVKHEGWVNVSRNYEGEYFMEGSIFDSLDSATLTKPINRVATIKIEWEE